MGNKTTEAQHARGDFKNVGTFTAILKLVHQIDEVLLLTEKTNNSGSAFLKEENIFASGLISDA